MNEAEVRRATPGDAAGIRRLLARVFGTEFSPEEWRWKFEQDPDGWFGVVGVLDGEIVGHYAGWGVAFLLEGCPGRLYSVGDVATDPSVRALGGRRGVYRRMAEAFYGAIAGEVPFCFGFPNARALRVSERIVGSRTLLPIEEIRVPAEAFPRAPSDAESGDSVGEEFDPLWDAARRPLTHAAVRDRARVNWRFHARPTRYYRMVWRRRGTEMLSWAALSVVGENATVADFLGREADGSDLSPLFAAAAEEARRLGARTLVFWSTPGGPARNILAGLSGERRDAGFPMIARVYDEESVDAFARSVHLVPSLYDLV